MLKQNTVTGNKGLAISATSNVKSILGLNDGDADYDKFINNIVSDDSSKTNEIAKYVAKIANDAYNKGKTDATKDNMGNFGKSQRQSGDDGSDAVGELGTQLAKASVRPAGKIDYFARKK